MDRGSFRSQRPSERIAIDKKESVVQIQEEPKQPVRPPSPRTYSREEKKKPLLKRLMIPVVIGLVVVLAAAGWLVWSTRNGTGIDNSKFQAVFLTSGQVYFGRLQILDSGYMKLTEVFYLQANSSGDDTESENPQNTTSDNMQLIKLGNEIHGPEDTMIISRDQVLFFENLKADGKVSQSIEQYRKNN